MKGQMFTTDFVASMIIFLMVLNLGLFALNESTQGQTRFNEENRMLRQAYQTSDLLVRTPGHPTDWNHSTVQIVGLADSNHILDPTKLSEFAMIYSYRQQRQELGVLPYEFRIAIESNGSILEIAGENGAGGVSNDPLAYIVEESDDTSAVRLLEAVNDSGITWDLYWPSGNDVPLNDARHVYESPEDGPTMFDAMLTNISTGGYQTIIAEDSNIAANDIDETEEFQSFVENGGVYIHTEQDPTLLEDVFDRSIAGTEDEKGNVTQTSPLLNDSLMVGDTIVFEDAQAAFSTADAVFVNDTDEPHGCLSCRWDYGDGTLYYLSDTVTGSGSTAAFTDGKAMFSGNISLSFGNPPEDANNIAVSRRSVLIDAERGVEKGEMKVILWQ